MCGTGGSTTVKQRGIFYCLSWWNQCFVCPPFESILSYLSIYTQQESAPRGLKRKNRTLRHIITLGRTLTGYGLAATGVLAHALPLWLPHSLAFALASSTFNSHQPLPLCPALYYRH